MMQILLACFLSVGIGDVEPATMHEFLKSMTSGDLRNFGRETGFVPEIRYIKSYKILSSKKDKKATHSYQVGYEVIKIGLFDEVTGQYKSYVLPKMRLEKQSYELQKRGSRWDIVSPVHQHAYVK